MSIAMSRREFLKLLSASALAASAPAALIAAVEEAVPEPILAPSGPAVLHLRRGPSDPWRAIGAIQSWGVRHPPIGFLPGETFAALEYTVGSLYPGEFEAELRESVDWSYLNESFNAGLPVEVAASVFDHVRLGFSGLLAQIEYELLGPANPLRALCVMEAVTPVTLQHTLDEEA